MIIFMLFELLFEVGPAIGAIFELGYEPKEEYFHELNEEDYAQLADDGVEITEKWYMLIPKEYEYQTDEVIVVSEKEKQSLIKANGVIEDYCQKSDKPLKNYKEKLSFVSNLLPDVFTQNTKYKRKHLKLV